MQPGQNEFDPQRRYYSKEDLSQIGYSVGEGRQPAGLVLLFIKEHLFLFPALKLMHGHLKRHFPNSVFHIEVIEDPEMIGYKDLSVFVSCGELSVGDSLNNLHAFDNDWHDWDDLTQGLITVELSYE